MIVTGASSGIGAAVAERFFREGWTVHAWDRVPGAHEGYRWSTVDVTDVASLQAAARDVESAEAVIACAGIASRGPVIEQEPSEWRRVVAVNLEGTLATGVAAFEAMRRSGDATFVTIGSVAGVNGFHQRAIYSASKAGVIALTKSLANEWAEAGVRTICVSPGFTETPMLDASIASGLTDRSVLIQHTAQRALVEPEAVADAIFAVCGPAFRRVTGAHLLVDAGWDSLSGF